MTGSTLGRAALSWTGGNRDLDRISELVGDRRIVLLGEATHGTHEFYAERARITRFLIEHQGFHAVAWEADWPDARAVDAFVHGRSGDARIALDGFARRFPEWMWRNDDVLSFVTWLRIWNDRCRTDHRTRRPVGVFGLDLYSLHESMAAVVTALERIDPQLARRARDRYACFDQFAEEPQSYGYATAFALDGSCQEAVVAELAELERTQAPQAVAEELFDAQQNARLVRDAEAYYRSMFAGRVSTWNLRDQHMLDSLVAVETHLRDQSIAEPKIVIWAHNSHIGDARATEMAESGEWNLGQLVRERWPGQTLLLGMTTFSGTVTAASDWDTPMRHMRVQPALAGSVEALCHDMGMPRLLLDLRDVDAVELRTRRLERAIGVVYRPATERQSHWFGTVLARQFDALLHLDHTRAVRPLDPGRHWHDPELPDTFPFGV